MHQSSFILVIGAVCTLLPTSVRSQNVVVTLPPEPKTRLESIENRIGTILLRANAPVGAVTAAKGVLSVVCKEDKDLGDGSVERGIAIGITSGDKPEDTTFLDREEIGGLLNAIDYFTKVDWAVTSLPNFSAAYETKAGFRIAVFVSKRSGTIEIAVRTTHEGNTPLVLTRDQLAQFKLLLEQAQKKIESLLKGNDANQN